MINSHFRSKRVSFALIFTLLCFNLSFADDNSQTPSPSWNIEMGIELPIEKTPWEIEHEHLFPIIYPTDEPPPQPALNPAEWEPMTGVLIRYPLAIPLILVAEMAEDVEVMTIVASEAQLQTAYNQYNNYGVNINNCTWLIAPTNTCYTRDYGPWYIFDGEGNQGIINHIYNRPSRPDDNRIPRVLGDSLGIPVYGLPLIHTGGNYMSDGMGVGMSTRLVLDENPELFPAEVDSIMLEYLGLDPYHKLEYIQSGGIHHIDCWAKLLHPGRILVKRLDPPNSLLEARAEYFASLVSPYGRPYEVVRIDCISSTPYTNALILNNKVLVPLFNNPLDEQAMHTWEEAMPGYEVLGFTHGWSSNDALHCRTMGITDRYMLRIVHIPLHDRENTGGDYLVEALVHPYSDQSLLPGSPELLWKTEGGFYTSVTMTYAVGDTYTAFIPEQPDGTDIYYYISAEDESGRQENHPYIGDGNPHHFFVGLDTVPPIVEFDPPSYIMVNNWPFTLMAYVLDNLWVSSVSLEYMINGIPQDTVEMPLQPLSAVYYDGTLTGAIQPDDQIQLRIKAVDTSINQNITYDPPIGYYTIDVVGGARTCVWNACGQGSGQVIFEMLERAGIQSVYTVEEPGNLNRFENMFIFLGVYSDNYVLDQSQEEAIVDYINRGHNVYLEGGDCWVYDPYHEELCEAFGIVGLNDGDEIENPILGVEGTFTQGMSFNYIGTNNYIDQIEPAAGAELIFQYDDIGIGVANQVETHSTVGLCFEFAGLVGNNPVSSQENIFRQILHYFYPTQPEVAGLGLDGVSTALPDHYSLNQNYPNPFNPVTTINFGLPKDAIVNLTVYNILGREVATLVNGVKEAGYHSVKWDASKLPSGIYIYRLKTDDFTGVKKMILIK